MNILRALVTWYIRNNMAHSCVDNRNAIFKAINDGMRSEFYEDNIYTRMGTTVKWLTDNGADFHPYPFLGQTAFPDAEALARCAKSGVNESTEHDRKPRYEVGQSRPKDN